MSGSLGTAAGTGALMQAGFASALYPGIKALYGKVYDGVRP
jgi:hypothetical protein